jgi:hypothetical protein
MIKKCDIEYHVRTLDHQGVRLCRSRDPVLSHGVLRLTCRFRRCERVSKTASIFVTTRGDGPKTLAAGRGESRMAAMARDGEELEFAAQ